MLGYKYREIPDIKCWGRQGDGKRLDRRGANGSMLHNKYIRESTVTTISGFTSNWTTIAGFTSDWTTISLGFPQNSEERTLLYHLHLHYLLLVFEVKCHQYYLYWSSHPFLISPVCHLYPQFLLLMGEEIAMKNISKILNTKYLYKIPGCLR